MARGDGAGCPGWSRPCDHAVAVPAVRRLLGAFISVPRQSGGLSSRMLIIGTHSAHCAADRGDLTVTVLGMVIDAPVAVQRQVLWLGRAQTVEFRSCRFSGVAQCLVRLWIPDLHHSGWLLEKFLRFST